MQRVFPQNIPPRLCLFFITVFIHSLATLIAGIYLGLEGAQNAGVALLILLLYLGTFVLIFFMALPRVAGRLSHHTRRLKLSARVSIVLLFIGIIAEAVIITPCLINNDALLLGKWENPIVPNDRIAISYQACEVLFEGKNPYTNINIIHLIQEFPSLKPSILLKGRFADVYPHPTEEQFNQVLNEALANPDNPPQEFISSVNYPSGSFLFGIPFVSLGIDLRWLYFICTLILIGLIAWRSPPNLRLLVIVGGLVSLPIWNAIIGGSMDPLYILLILLGWILRRRLWIAAILMGLALTCKQTALIFILLYLILQLRESEWRQAFQSAIAIVGVFLITNIPFIAADPAAWLSGVLAPMLEPYVPEGVGIVSFATLSTSPVPSLPFSLIEVAVLAGSLIWYYFNCRKAPQTALLLGILPFFFAWRSLSSYFAFIPLLVLGAVIIEEVNISNEDTKIYSAGSASQSPQENSKARQRSGRTPQRCVVPPRPR
jgi:hypothetical protein